MLIIYQIDLGGFYATQERHIMSVHEWNVKYPIVVKDLEISFLEKQNEKKKKTNKQTVVNSIGMLVTVAFTKDDTYLSDYLEETSVMVLEPSPLAGR